MNEVRVVTKPYNKLPYELQRYTYSFIYPDVRLSGGFPNDDSIYTLVRELVDTYGSFMDDVIVLLSDLYYKYFPGETVYHSENELVIKYLYRVFDRDERGNRMYWYEETASTDYNGFITELSNKIIYQKKNAGNNNVPLYKLLSSYQYHLSHSDEYYDMVMNEEEC